MAGATGQASEGSNKAAGVRSVWSIIRAKATEGVLVGGLIAVTGFGPEHWFAVAFQWLHLPNLIDQAKGVGLDFRLALVGVGVAIIAGDTARRISREKSRGAVEQGLAEVAAAAESADEPPPLSIVVLPFSNLSDEAGQDYFVDGLVDDITAEMSRLSGAFVISRNTAFTYKGKPIDVKAVTHELNVRYALEGSVRKNDQQLRVSAKLVDGASRATLWAEKFDRQIAQLFELQDAIVTEMASALNVELIAAESRRSQKAAIPKAIDLIMQAKAAANEGLSLDNYQKAIRFYEQALELDPDNVEALGGLAQRLGVIFVGNLGRWNSPDEIVARGEPAARKALSLAPANSLARTALATMLRIQGRWEEALQNYSEALQRDSNSLMAQHGMGFTLLALGRYEESAAAFTRAMALSPRDPITFYSHSMFGLLEFVCGNFQSAIDHLTIASRLNAAAPSPYLYKALAHRRLGRESDAMQALAVYKSMANVPLTIKGFRAQSIRIMGGVVAHLSVIEEALRCAGFPEE